MKARDIATEIKFVNHHVDSHNDQHDYLLVGKFRDTIAITIDYSEFDEKLHINMIESHIKRKGFAVEAVKYLQSLYPHYEIDFGYTTDGGSKLVSKLEFNEVQSEYFDKFQRLKDAQEEWKSIVNSSSNFDLLNDLHDEIEDLKDELHDKSPYIKLVKY